jgi:predicted transcriptional regulator
MNQETFFSSLDPQMMRIAQEVVHVLKSRPKQWSKEMIIELTDKVQKGALKLERAGKKEMFYRASHEQQLVMMGELTAGLVN